MLSHALFTCYYFLNKQQQKDQFIIIIQERRFWGLYKSEFHSRPEVCGNLSNNSCYSTLSVPPRLLLTEILLNMLKS